MIRFTSKIRRGLILMRGLLIDSFDDSKPPTASIVKGWTAKDQREFNAAMAWLEQVEAQEGAKPSPTHYAIGDSGAECGRANVPLSSDRAEVDCPECRAAIGGGG